MGYKKFTAQQIEQIRKNPYVIKVSESSITYSEEFKKEFIAKLQLGDNPSKILSELGFNTSVLGRSRIRSITQRCKRYALRVEGTRDVRKDMNINRAKIKDLTAEEQIEMLKHKNLVLEQENEFLKKMIFLARKTKWEKSRLKKNIK